MKEARLKRQPALWFHFYDILEKSRTIRIEIGSVLPETGVGDGE